jgi:RNA polymerase sigma-70 factor, ECF subfamily
VLVMTAGRREIADEATAEAFARLFDYREGVRDPVAWVHRTAFRLAAAEARRERVTSGDVPDVPAAALSVVSPVVSTALRRVSPEQRVALFLHYFADLPVAEVARLCGVSPLAIKLRLHRGRRSLRGLLETERRYA